MTDANVDQYVADDDVNTYTEPSRSIYNRVIVRRDRIAGAILMGAATATSSIVQRILDVVCREVGDGVSMAVCENHASA